MFGKNWGWWVGKRSLFAKSGLKEAISDGVTSSVGSGGKFLDSLSSFFGGKSNPQVTVDHGMDDNTKMILGVAFIYLAFIKK